MGEATVDIVGTFCLQVQKAVESYVCGTQEVGGRERFVSQWHVIHDSWVQMQLITGGDFTKKKRSTLQRPTEYNVLDAAE